jgi:hypothetical protein
MTLSDAQQSARASTKRSLPDLRDLTDARDHLQPPSRNPDVAEALFQEALIVQLQRPRNLDLIRPLLQVGLSKDFFKVEHKADISIAAAAAKINAQIQAKKGIQHVDVPPIRSTLSPTGGKSASPGAGNSASTVNGEMYIADGDYIRDIEVNDLRNRYTLTKGSTQKMVNTPCVNISTDISGSSLYIV